MKNESQSKNLEVVCVTRALAGDARAFESLYKTQASRVLGYFLRSGFTSSLADDLTQDTFIRVFKSLKTFDPNRGRFGYWVATIAKNVARRKWSSRKHPDNFDSQLAEEMFADPSINQGANAAEAGEEIDAVQNCISLLNNELRDIVYLRYVKGFSTRGISAETSIPEATVRLRLAEASGKIKLCLKSKGIFE